MSVLVSDEVAMALASDGPVVALETSVIGQGLPAPRNLECVDRMTDAIRGGGAVPAWIGVVDGAVPVGLTDDELRRFAVPGAASKVARRDYPIAVGRDGGIYYVPYSKTGPRELVRRMPDGDRSVFATLPKGKGPEPQRWVNGTTAAADGALFVTDDDAIHRIGRDGTV